MREPVEGHIGVHGQLCRLWMDDGTGHCSTDQLVPFSDGAKSSRPLMGLREGWSREPGLRTNVLWV
jgi:hypothetical protein